MNAKPGDKIQFETSNGVVTGTLAPRYLDEARQRVSPTQMVVNLNEEGVRTLSGLFRFTDVIYFASNGWVVVDHEDSCYGSPEYKAKLFLGQTTSW